jgi:predicted HAD superfamily phosphohydrolase YqeG
MNHVVEDSRFVTADVVDIANLLLCSNPDHHIDLTSDVTRILHDMNQNNIQLAIVSNNGHKHL